jgi:hypothetical protein
MYATRFIKSRRIANNKYRVTTPGLAGRLCNSCFWRLNFQLSLQSFPFAVDFLIMATRQDKKWI